MVDNGRHCRRFPRIPDIILASLSHLRFLQWMADQDTKYCRATQLLEAEIDSEIVGLDRERGKCFGFIGVASDVWRLLKQPMSRSEIRAALLADYDVDEAACDRDLSELLEDMGKKGLVVTTSSQ